MAKLKIKHGNAEFEAEGEPEEIKAQYEAFLGLLQSAPAPASAPTVVTPLAGQPDLALQDRIFLTGKDGTISLKVLPRGDRRSADALLLLMYGAQKIGGAENVYGTALAKAARVSGVQVDRIDRTLECHKPLFVRGGLRRGATYTLNNQGFIEAEKMMQAIFS